MLSAQPGCTSERLSKHRLSGILVICPGEGALQTQVGLHLSGFLDFLFHFLEKFATFVVSFLGELSLVLVQGGADLGQTADFLTVVAGGDEVRDSEFDFTLKRHLPRLLRRFIDGQSMHDPRPPMSIIGTGTIV